jgi:hypothetical protein
LCLREREGGWGVGVRLNEWGGGGWMLRDQRIRLLNGSNQRILIEDGILLNVNTTHTRERVRVKVSD